MITIPHGFDFDGALQVGAAANEFQEGVRRDVANLQSSRDQMLDAWRGPFSDYLRERAEDNDDRLERRMAGLERKSQRWVTLWVNQVNRINQRSWQIAMAEHREFLASLHRPPVFELPQFGVIPSEPYWRNRPFDGGRASSTSRSWSPEPQAASRAWRELPSRDEAWIPWPPFDLFEAPVRPRPAARPANFRPTEPPFAHYRQQGWNWHVSYQNDPPLQLNGGILPIDPGFFPEYRAEAYEISEAEEFVEDRRRITPINALLERGIDAEMFIAGAGTYAPEVSIDLKLVRRYLRVSREFSQRWFPELEKLSQTWWTFERINNVSVRSPRWFRTFSVFNRIRRTRIFVRTIYRLLKGFEKDSFVDPPLIELPVELPASIFNPGLVDLPAAVVNPTRPDPPASVFNPDLVDLPAAVVNPDPVSWSQVSSPVSAEDSSATNNPVVAGGSEPQVLANGTTLFADGTQVLSDGTTLFADGTQVLPDGTTVQPPVVSPPIVPAPVAPPAAPTSPSSFGPNETFGFGSEPTYGSPSPVPPPPVAGPESPQTATPPPPVAGPESPQTATPPPPTTNQSPFQQIPPPINESPFQQIPLPSTPPPPANVR